MSSLRLVYAAATGEFEQAITALQRPIAIAATAAITEAGDQVKREVRADIASAGFSTGWQNAFRAQVYPKNGTPSMNAAVHFFHKIPYANVFEDGATISGKPLLWLPLSGAPFPAARRGSRMTPAKFVAEVGPLVSVNLPGKPPMLFARAAVGKRGRAGKTFAALKRGGAGNVPWLNVPLFVGVDVTKISKKFHIAEIVRRVGATIGELYLKHVSSGSR